MKNHHVNFFTATRTTKTRSSGNKMSNWIKVPKELKNMYEINGSITLKLRLQNKLQKRFSEAEWGWVRVPQSWPWLWYSQIAVRYICIFNCYIYIFIQNNNALNDGITHFKFQNRGAKSSFIIDKSEVEKC